MIKNAAAQRHPGSNSQVRFRSTTRSTVVTAPDDRKTGPRPNCRAELDTRSPLFAQYRTPARSFSYFSIVPVNRAVWRRQHATTKATGPGRAPARPPVPTPLPTPPPGGAPSGLAKYPSANRLQLRAKRVGGEVRNRPTPKPPVQRELPLPPPRANGCCAAIAGERGDAPGRSSRGGRLALSRVRPPPAPRVRILTRLTRTQLAMPRSVDVPWAESALPPTAFAEIASAAALNAVPILGKPPFFFTRRHADL